MLEERMELQGASREWEKGGHVLELDGIRGLAILLVTIYRFTKDLAVPTWVTNLLGVGEHGVDLFFVLSGFLITGILLRSKGRADFFTRFYYRRTLRIMPLYLLAIFLFACIVPWTIGEGTLFDLASQNQFYLWTYGTNFYMAWSDSWCFGPLDSFWSLAIEEHFYFLWPVCIFFLSPKNALRLAIALVMASASSRVGYAYCFGNSVAANVLTIFRLDALGLGAALSLAMHIDCLPRWRKSYTLAWLGLGAILTASVLLHRSIYTSTLFGWAAFWMIGLWMLLDSKPTGLAARVFRTRPLVHFGKYSYAMYIFQLPILTLVSLHPMVQEMKKTWIGGIGVAALLFAVTWAVSLLSWNLVEKHFLKLKDWSRQCKQGLATNPSSQLSLSEPA